MKRVSQWAVLSEQIENAEERRRFRLNMILLSVWSNWKAASNIYAKQDIH